MRLWGRWLLASVVSGVLFLPLGDVLGGVLSLALYWNDLRPDLLTVGLALLLAWLAGTVVGWPQARAIGAAQPDSAERWVATTILGMVIGLSAGYLSLLLLGKLWTLDPLRMRIGFVVLDFALVGACLGLGVGAAQGALVRGGPGRVVGWAVACGLGSAIACILVRFGLYGPMAVIGQWGVAGLVLQFGIGGAIGGLAFGLMTGPVLLWLLRPRLSGSIAP
jgi:hypothetical protein